MKQIREFKATIVMSGDVCELTDEQATECVRRQIQGLYPMQEVSVECVLSTKQE